MEWFALVLIYGYVLSSLVNAAFTKYYVIPGSLITNGASWTEVRRIYGYAGCCALCDSHPNCTAVNIYSQSNTNLKCELKGKEAGTGLYETSPAAGWDSLFKAPTCVTNPVKLVTGPYGVNDTQLTASSTWYSAWSSNKYMYLPEFGRLDDASHWSPDGPKADQYLQVDFLAAKTILSIITQGSSGTHHQWVSSYQFFYSTKTNCANLVLAQYNAITENGTNKVFPGNVDDVNYVTNDLTIPVQARCVRLNPLTWSDAVSMRFDLVGC